MAEPFKARGDYRYARSASAGIWHLFKPEGDNSLCFSMYRYRGEFSTECAVDKDGKLRVCHSCLEKVARANGKTDKRVYEGLRALKDAHQIARGADDK